jgi:hypothetical protein
VQRPHRREGRCETLSESFLLLDQSEEALRFNRELRLRVDELPRHRVVSLPATQMRRALNEPGGRLASSGTIVFYR